MRTSFFGAVLLLVAQAAAGATPAALPALPRVYVNPEPVAIADFTLTDQDGRKRRFASLRGRPALVFFGFTHCPNVCPDTMVRLKALHEARDGALKSARVVMISVDGERDTPERLTGFLRPLSPEFIGLTGDPQATAEIAARFSAAFFREPAAKDGSYNVMHSSQVFVVDAEGRLRAAFVGASLEDMATITARLIEEAS